MEWLELLSAAIGGGATVKLIDILYKEYREWRAKRVGHIDEVDNDVAPLLRSVNELSGKLRSLAEKDFIPINRVVSRELDNPDVASLSFLFIQFWSEIELLRLQKLNQKFSKSKRGNITIKFIDCLESKRVRIIDRVSQRALGECATVNLKTINYVDFRRLYDSDPYVKKWLMPLLSHLGETNHTATKQKFLIYASILHSMIDTLDPSHLVTKKRPSVSNKLNKKSRKELRYRIFGVYLNFVEDKDSYILKSNDRRGSEGGSVMRKFIELLHHL